MRLDQTPGTVCILASETGRYTSFWVNMLSLGFSIPPQSSLKVLIGSDISESRNQAMEAFDGDWIFFIDDDHNFAPELVTQLLAREVDVVTPLCLRRNSPFLPVATGLDGNFLDIRTLAPDELVEVQAVGSSGMLIKRAVVEAIEPPWFALDYTGGDLRVSEDINFCQKVRDAGFKIHVDAGARLAHVTTVAVWPTYSELEERWLTGLTVGDGAELYMDPAELPVNEGLAVGGVTGPDAVPTPS